MKETESIPRPPAHFLLGNAPDLGKVSPVQSLMKLARRYGPIFRLKLPGRSPIFLSGFELVDEVCSDKRFDKRVTGAVAKLRPLGGDGLFTARTEEPNWKKAHNILVSAFSFQAMRNYFPVMAEIADQLASKWESLGPDSGLDVAADMTRMTLDTIARCGFDYRFDSLSGRDQHPFVTSMVRALKEGLERAQRLWIEEWLSAGKHRQFDQDLELLFATVDRVVQERRNKQPSAEKTPDLLELMLHGVDKSTGETLDDVNIRFQIITFLIAGHETTSGLLSFALYFLLKNPDVLARARAEVDSVVAPGAHGLTEFEQLPRLRYLSQVLKETLRLWPTAPAVARRPREDTTLAGKYSVTESDSILVLTPMLHRDTKVWGEGSELFDPEHFSPEAEQKRPPNAFLPFGIGQRSCIGRFFAMQEATLVLATLLHRFDLSADPGYELKVKETLTLKPEGFLIRAARRSSGAASVSVASATPGAADARPGAQATSLLVLYGSNMGTSEELARQLARDGESYGYPTEVAALDDCPSDVRRSAALLVVTSSYNGNPPDNAVKFGSRLADRTLAFSGVKYAVFGCGHHDWVATYQAFPVLVDSGLAAAGAVRVMEKGSGDSGGDLFGDFRVWRKTLWERMASALGVEPASRTDGTRSALYGVEIVNEPQPNPFVVSFSARPMVIVENRELQSGNGKRRPARSTRHIELALPDGIGYRPGDHLGVIARNPRETVRRVLARFGFDDDTVVRLRHQGKGRATLPIDRAISVNTLLGEYVELQDVATQDQISVLAEHAQSPSDRLQLSALCGEGDAARRLYQTEILRPRVSMIDLLEEYPACSLPFAAFLEMLPPLHPRYYSISSSPLKYQSICSITVGVLDEPARSGRGRYRGVCSNFLGSKPKGTSVHAFVRDPGTPFRPPRNPRTPIIMIGAGTGVAPFIGFLQERAWLKSHDYSVGPSLLFFGCRHSDSDFYYKTELEEHARAGVVELVCAFSRENPDRKVYVQDRICEHKDRVWELIQDGAVVYLCGDASRLVPPVRAALCSVFRGKTGAGETESEEWLNDLVLRQRYLTDVWAST